MTRDGSPSRRQRRRMERDRAFSPGVPATGSTRPIRPDRPVRDSASGIRPRTERIDPSERAYDVSYDHRAAYEPGRSDPTAAPEHGTNPSGIPADSGTNSIDSAHAKRDAAVSAGRTVGRGAGAAARLAATASRTTVRVARRASEAQGAGESGLARLIQVHAFSSAGDAAVTIGLAGTVFFSVSSAQAKSSVLLFLCLTMLPFAVVAPFIGPLLDRYRHGRRWAIGTTLAVRAFLCWVLAEAVQDKSTWLFPVALCVLVASKAYLVTRSAAAPRLLPDQLTLVKANGRLSLAGVIGAAAAGGLAGGAAKLGGAPWALRMGALLFAIGTVLAILLPPKVDSAVGEKPAPSGLATGGGSKYGITASVVTALRANVGLRWLSGFLTIFLAFLVRIHPFPGWEDRKTLLLALVVGAAGAGNSLGTVMGSVLRIASPKMIVLGTLVADAILAVVAAVHFSLSTAIAVGLVAGIGQQLGKLALDSQIQDTVPEHMRTSVFGRSETLLQLSWVVGGIIAVAIPSDATLGMVLAAVLLVGWASVVLVWHTGRELPLPARVKSANPMARRHQPVTADLADTVPSDAAPVVTPTRPQTTSVVLPAPAQPAVPRERDAADTIGVRRSDVAAYRPDDEHPADGQQPRHPGGWR